MQKNSNVLFRLLSPQNLKRRCKYRKIIITLLTGVFLQYRQNGMQTTNQPVFSQQNCLQNLEIYHKINLKLRKYTKKTNTSFYQ
jgi:hypothetical protein